METLELKNEFDFSDNDFWNISRLVTSHSGIELPESKKSLVYSRLVRRIRKLNLKNFSEYYNKVNKELISGDESEFLALINAITTNVTHLFREQHHFDHLMEHLEILSKEKNKIRIWSCAASIGAEPWSIAMVVHKFLKSNPSCDVKILASDIDSEVLNQAQKGIYDIKLSEVENHEYLKKYLEPSDEDVAHKTSLHKVYRVKDEVRHLVDFRQINLLHNWQNSIHEKFDFVFCRNVIIYFSKETQRTLFKKISPSMHLNAYLYLGHSESLLDISEDFENLKRTIYKKVR